MDELWIETAFGRVYGQATGRNSWPLVLAIHGWSQRNGWHIWQSLMQPLAEAGFWVVSVDMPGWGQSRPGALSPLSTQDGVAVVLALLDGLGVKMAALMGKSWGGAVAIETALQHPGRITHLILTAPAFADIHRLAGLTRPVLLAWSLDDPVIPYHYATPFVAAIPNGRLLTYPTGGHSAALKNATDFAPHAIQFLNSQ